ncbi:Uncharacterised protein [Burkholderia pseudomallei]|nr:Uncharacterised protein [Burkholderia pseudomallei]CAJ8193874.1 Uncharacterised protein [Burkholderia pseudomallei]CAJ8933720.1 Uncharacterised protein [Burkholderia pseudomallei]
MHHEPGTVFFLMEINLMQLESAQQFSVVQNFASHRQKIRREFNQFRTRHNLNVIAVHTLVVLHEFEDVFNTPAKLKVHNQRASSNASQNVIRAR